jgi:hypothetical protein
MTDACALPGLLECSPEWHAMHTALIDSSTAILCFSLYCSWGELSTLKRDGSVLRSCEVTSKTRLNTLAAVCGNLHVAEHCVVQTAGGIELQQSCRHKACAAL